MYKVEYCGWVGVVHAKNRASAEAQFEWYVQHNLATVKNPAAYGISNLAYTLE